MSNETCILTTKDFTILEVMRDRCLDRDGPIARILKRKIDNAQVVFRDDVPEGVATLSSRVTFRVNALEPDTRVLSHDRMDAPVGMFLPITTAWGLGLLGLVEGQEFRLGERGPGAERIVLEKVLYQPEAARREKEAAERMAASSRGRPALKLVHGASRRDRTAAPGAPDGCDPGPSAA